MNVPTEAEDGSTAAAVSQPVLRAGLLGRGIQESRTPRMHEAEGARLGLSYSYDLFDFDSLGLDDSDLADVVGRARRDGYAGLNVTHPFKERVIAILDGLSPDAAAIGAVNTVVFRDGVAVGHNTDCWGFAESVRRGLQDPELGAVVLIGAGGAGKAVAKALLDLGVQRLAITDSDRSKATRLIDSLRARGSRVAEAMPLEPALARADGLVNATPVGMAKYPGLPVERTWLRPDLWVADVIYFPAETELLRAARAAGCQTLPGAGMAIYQAVKAFELITGMAPDPEQMARHFQAE
jgi:shikimate dehydrogenase